MRKRTPGTALLESQGSRKKQKFQSSILNILNQVLQVDPNNSYVYNLLGDCFDELGEKEEAEKNYKMGIQCNPLSCQIDCYINYGLLLYNRGQREQAEKIYEMSLQIKGQDKIALNNFAILLFEMGKLERAKRMFLRCKEVDPNNKNCEIYLRLIADNERNNRETHIKAEAVNYRSLFLKSEQKVMEKQRQIVELKKKLLLKDKQICSFKAQVQNMKQEQEQSGRCKICLVEIAMFANSNCGHLSSCEKCKIFLGNKCPLCRKQGTFKRVFSSLIKQSISGHQH